MLKVREATAKAATKAKAKAQAALATRTAASVNARAGTTPTVAHAIMGTNVGISMTMKRDFIT